jgi:lipoate-protein ligase A
MNHPLQPFNQPDQPGNRRAVTAEDYTPATWRVIIHPAMDGMANMAIDEAIAEAVGARRVPPTLRFYAWEPACLSLGYAQPVADVDTDRLREQGWDVVRRLTGGRAILHVDELTYSVAVPMDEPRVEGGVVESYRRLSTGLLTGLELLGAAVHADRAAEEAHGFKGPVCFEVPSDYEITVEGRKLLGSAQTRRADVVLQHGALPLGGDITRVCDALAFPDEAERKAARGRVRARAVTLSEALGHRVGMAQAVGALMAGFCEALNLTLDEGIITPAEQARAEELRSTKYAAEEWTNRH